MRPGYHRISPYSDYVADRLRHRGIFYISRSWTRWAKKYLNRRYRRKGKQSTMHESTNE